MRFIIYGAGGIGSGIGGHLWRTGHDTILIGRSGHGAGSRRPVSGCAPVRRSISSVFQP
jgi:prephenate dehydrogenase